jgi:septation ring formation regulator EzrA
MASTTHLKHRAHQLAASGEGDFSQLADVVYDLARNLDDAEDKIKRLESELRQAVNDARQAKEEARRR